MEGVPFHSIFQISCGICLVTQYGICYLKGIYRATYQHCSNLLKDFMHFCIPYPASWQVSFQGLQFLSSDNLSMYLVYTCNIYCRSIYKYFRNPRPFDNLFKRLLKVRRPAQCIQCMQWKCFCSLWKVSNSWSTYSVQVLSSGNLSMYSMYAI